MSFVGSNILAGASGQGGAGGYAIERSLRFNSGDSAYLNRTPSSAGNRRTWTWSCWIKRNNLSSAQNIFVGSDNPTKNNTTFSAFYFHPDNNIYFGGWNSPYISTNAVYRDASAWYHIVLSVDTTQSTSTDRIKVYVNNELQSYSTGAGFPGQNTDLGINQAYPHYIGGNDPASGYASHMYADVHFIDGQALAATDFGETDDNGVWQPKEFAGTYATPASTVLVGSPSYPSSFTSSGNKTSDQTGLSFGSWAGTYTGAETKIFKNSNTTAFSLQLSLAGPTTDRLLWYSDNATDWTYVGNVSSLSNPYTLSGHKYYATSEGSGSATVTASSPATGVNSFHLDFKDNSSNAALGTDTSGNSNTWTVNNLIAAPAGLATANQGMDVVTYTGNGSTQSISSLAFQPDFVWIKNRTVAFSHLLYDVIRGAGPGKAFSSDTSGATGSSSDGGTYGYLNTFNTNGFSVVQGSSSNSYTNGSSQSYVAWCWKAGGAASSNTDGTITSSVSANTTYGFSVCKFTAPSSGNFTLGHGLSAVPSLILMKEDDNSRNWHVFHSSISTGTNKYLRLNGSNATLTYSNVWGDALPTSSVFGLGVGGSISSNADAVAYVWSEVAGFSKFGSYSGSSSAVTLDFGFEPKFLMIKLTNGLGDDWAMFDNQRPNGLLNANSYGVENTNASSSGRAVTFTSTGAIVTGPNGQINNAGQNYIYAAFAKKPDESVVDSLVDTPTNAATPTDTGIGGEVVGNYATWNPLAKTYSTLPAITDGNLTEGPNAGGTVLGTIAVSSGKWYWEIAVDTIGGALVGATSIDGALTTNQPGYFANSASYIRDGRVKNNGSDVGNYATYTAGDIIGVALDMDNGAIKFYKNNTLVVTISSNISGTWTPAVADFNGSGSILNANFGARAFAYTAPSGYKALCTANLPEPTIADGSQYFDTTLWSGNNTARDISTNFSPDFVWTKLRNVGNNHNLFDSVRGVEKKLRSSANSAEATESGSLTAFNSDGFSLGTSGNVNGNNYTYVAWAWDAGSSNTTIAAGGLNSSVYDQSQTWSNSLTSSNGFWSGQGATNAFDGTGSSVTGTNNGGTITLSPNLTIPANSTIEVRPSSNPSGYTVVVNGVSNSITGDTFQTVNYDGATTLTSITVASAGSASGDLKGIKINGKLLVDSGVSVTNVPSIASTVRANPSAGFSIVKWTGNYSAATVGHGLNDAVKFYIVKNLDQSNDWLCWHTGLSGGGQGYIRLNTTGAAATASSPWNSTVPTNSVFSLGVDGNTNGNGDEMIAYCFAPVEGYSAMGSYSSGSDPFVFTGFSPRFVLLKKTNAVGHWYMFDSERGPINPNETWIEANGVGAEQTHANGDIRFLSNGFQPIGSDIDAGGGTYIYYAVAEHPFKTARAR